MKTAIAGRVTYGERALAFKHLMRFAAIVLLSLTTAAAAARPLQIVGFGDSLMAGYGLEPGQSFPERLEAALKEAGRDVAVSNAGVSGDTTSGGLARLDWSVPDGTDLVILELGANDMLRGIRPDEVKANLDRMLDRLAERGIPVLLCGMVAAPNLGADYGRRFDAIYPELADKHDVTLYPFFLEGVAAQQSLQLADGMHPNAAAIDIIVGNILPVVEKMLDEHARGNGT